MEEKVTVEFLGQLFLLHEGRLIKKFLDLKGSQSNPNSIANLKREKFNYVFI